MSATHIHLILNHLPLVGTLVGIGLLVAGMYATPSLRKTALALFAISGLIAVAVNFTGEAAEEALEAVRVVSHDLVEAHEHAAKPAFISAVILGLLSLGTLAAKRKRELSKSVSLAFVAMSLVVLVLMGRAATLGGRISHPEIRGAAVVTAVDGESDTSTEKSDVDNDD